MARKRLLMEMGMGTDLRGQDYTKAAIRALKDALWHNSVSVAPALGYPRESMQVDVQIGVADPSAVDHQQVAEVLPYGQAQISVVKGGLDIVNEETGNVTVIANAAAVVYLDIEQADPSGEPIEQTFWRRRMSLKRIILEMGTGNDLYGEDYTKAARRAVHDALHHSSLTLFRSLGLNRDDMQVTVTIGVQKPEQVDSNAIAAEIPYGTVTVNVELGGLNVEDEDAGTVSVIAAAGVEALMDLPDGQFTLPASQ